MPSISIDTFFACTLMVSVVLISTVLSSGILASHINSLQGLNQEEYFQAISEYILSNAGTPADWGSNATTIPDTFGLAKTNSLYTNELDIDKVSRLNTQNAFALTYVDTLRAARLKDIALSISISQMMNISISLSSNSTSLNSTKYSFKIYANEDGAPVQTFLHYYVIARNFVYDAFNATANDGTSHIDVEIPNTSSGTVSLVIFARPNHDSRMTAFAVYSFGHLSADPSLDGTFAKLTPLNYTLSIDLNGSETTLEKCYALSYGYRFDLAQNAEGKYQIPEILEDSPTVLIVLGSSNSSHFTEWASYPQIPFDSGADFKNAESYSYSYIVAVKNVLCRLTLRFGGISQ
jgi:hypothetical protein